MDVTAYMERFGHENLVVCQERSLGLKAFIAIHDTTLGPAAGGTRVWSYSSEWDAIEDALRLARGMTYKYAAGGVNLGGGKCVVMVKPGQQPGEAFFRTLGRFIERLGGMFLTGADVGTDLPQMKWLRSETSKIITLPVEWGGAGDIALATARGVLHGMRAGAEKVWETSDLAGRRVLVQGVGKVGRHLTRMLVADNAQVTISDVSAAAIDSCRSEIHDAELPTIPPNDVYDYDCDIYSPCALGKTLNPNSVSQLRARLVAGAANNQLEDDSVAELLQQRGIVYVPDYVGNAGGAVYDADRVMLGMPHDDQRAMTRVDQIGSTVRKIFDLAESEGVTSAHAADLYAEWRIDAVRRSQSLAVSPLINM